MQSVMILHPREAAAVFLGVIYTRKRGDLCCAGRESSIVTSRTITREVSFSKEARARVPRSQRGVAVRAPSLREPAARSITIPCIVVFHSYFSFEIARASEAATIEIRCFCRRAYLVRLIRRRIHRKAVFTYREKYRLGAIEAPRTPQSSLASTNLRHRLSYPGNSGFLANLFSASSPRSQ